MAEHDFQSPSVHFNYNTVVLPTELRLWTTGAKERWNREDVAALHTSLTRVLASMPAAPERKEDDTGRTRQHTSRW
jgi:hypothetical protein